MKKAITLKLNIASLGISKQSTAFDNEEVMFESLKKLAEYDGVTLPGESQMVNDNLNVPAWKYVLLNTYTDRSAGTYYSSEGKFMQSNYRGIYDSADEFIQGCEEKAKKNIQSKLTSFEKQFLTKAAVSAIDNVTSD